MKKVITLLSFLILLLVSLACTVREKRSDVILSPADYGAVTGDSLFDNGPIFRRMIADARRGAGEGRSVRIRLGSGTYHFFPNSLEKYELFISNHDHVGQRPVAFYIDSTSHLTIEGEGAKLEFHGRQIPFVIRRSANVTLKGFSVDYPRPALSQLEVLAVQDDVVKVKVLPETKYRIDGNRFVLEGEGYEQQLFVAMPFGADRHMKWGRADVSFDPREMVQDADGTLTLYGWGEAQYLREGDRYVLRSYYRPTPGIVLMDAEDMTVRDVHVHYAEGMALVAQNTRNITLDGFRVDVEEGSDRYFTTQADATHFSGCRGLITSQNGLYEHMADDAINVHGTYLRVDKVEDGKTMLATFAHEQSFGYTWFEEGDTLRLIDRRTLLPLTEGLSATVLPISDTQLRITILTEGLDIRAWSDKQVAVENLSAHPKVVFTDNTVRNNRARGALFSTPKPVLVERNFFDHTHGSAILLCGDANGWYESGPCYNITIRNNRFLNALTARYQFTDGIISIAPAMPELVKGQYYHGRVVITDNTFETFKSPLLYAKSVAEVLMHNNKVVYNEDYRPLFDKIEDYQTVEVGSFSND